MGEQQSLESFNRALFAGRVFEARESRLRKAFAMIEAEAERGRALDIAAGSGIASELLARQGWEVSAVEMSEALIEQITARGIADVREHVLESGPLPFADETFRVAFAGEIIEHLVDTAGFLEDVRRVLVTGGVLVLTTPNLASLENRVRLLCGRYPRWVDTELAGEGHVRAYTLPVLRRQLERQGFDVEQATGNFVPIVSQRFLHDVLFPPLARTGDWLPKLSQGLIVKARKR
jgi:2-polyprenyl-3-methyl-5-hydroxy-6-metoxy-1,4-benzoquinol methylase